VKIKDVKIEVFMAIFKPLDLLFDGINTF